MHIHFLFDLIFQFCIGLFNQDDDGDSAFHIAADAAKMIRENLNWIVVMLQHPSPAIEVRNHRRVIIDLKEFYLFFNFMISMSRYSYLAEITSSV